MRIENNDSGPTEPAHGPDGRESLLADVDFKWLMAGHGMWFDARRFEADHAYAGRLLQLALASPSAALRDCAAAMLAKRQHLTARTSRPAPL